MSAFLEGEFAAGRTAYEKGLGEVDCPHMGSIDAENFWETSEAKRQAWLRGFYSAAKLRRT